MAFPILALNARLNENTSFMQEGTGFVMGSPPTLTVTDQSASPYTFTVSLVEVISPSRLRVTVTCSFVPTTKISKTSIVVALTAGSGTVSTDAVPIVLRTRHNPMVNYANVLPTQHLNATNGKESVIYIPVTGMGENITANVSSGQSLPAGFSIVKAVQLKGTPFVKVRLLYSSLLEILDLPAPTSTFAVTLTAEDDTTVDTPPIPVTYETDPT